MKGQNIPTAMALKILAVIAVIVIALTFIAPMIFKIPGLAQIPKESKEVYSFSGQKIDYNTYFSNLDGVVYPEQPLSTDSFGLLGVLSRSPIIWDNYDCSSCTLSQRDTSGGVITYEEYYCDSCNNPETGVTGSNCKMCFNCTGSDTNANCDYCTGCEDRSKKEICERLKGAIKYSYATGKYVDLYNLGYRYRHTLYVSDISSMLTSCPSEDIMIEVKPGVEEKICTLDWSNIDIGTRIYNDIQPTNQNYDHNKLIYSRFINGSLDTSYEICERLLPIDEIEGDKKIHFLSNFNKIDNGYGNIRIRIGNIRTTENGKCAFDVFICNQYSFAKTPEDAGMKIFNYFRNFGDVAYVDNEDVERYDYVANNDVGDKVKAYDCSGVWKDPLFYAVTDVQHTITFKPVVLKLDRDITLGEIKDSISKGMNEYFMVGSDFSVDGPTGIVPKWKVTDGNSIYDRNYPKEYQDFYRSIPSTDGGGLFISNYGGHCPLNNYLRYGKINYNPGCDYDLDSGSGGTTGDCWDGDGKDNIFVDYNRIIFYDESGSPITSLSYTYHSGKYLCITPIGFYHCKGDQHNDDAQCKPVSDGGYYSPYYFTIKVAVTNSIENCKYPLI